MTRLVTNLPFKIYFKKKPKPPALISSNLPFQTEKNFIRSKKPVQVISLVVKLGVPFLTLQVHVNIFLSS